MTEAHPLPVPKLRENWRVSYLTNCSEGVCFSLLEAGRGRQQMVPLKPF